MGWDGMTQPSTYPRVQGKTPEIENIMPDVYYQVGGCGLN